MDDFWLTNPINRKLKIKLKNGNNMESKIENLKSKIMKVLYSILIVAAVVLNACGGAGADQSQAAAAQDSTVLVKVQTVGQQPVEQLTELTGNIEAYKVNQIAPTIPGRIDNILVEVGNRVHKGQLLVQMDRTNLVQALLQLANAE